MWITKDIEYGLRLLVRIARDPDTFHSTRPLSAGEGIPEGRARRALLRLRKAGVLEAERGRQGGYKLAKPPEKIKIATVLRALDEDLALALAGEGRRRLTPAEEGPTAAFWKRLEEKFWELLEEATLADLM
ncbi:MAG: Rrf2 family transcriptional regulator [Candidatus Bipolaricaulota bacterium]|nr:Rrf2 family transcriptional regulator [Candidatus Bipolaricaulota bacterium]